MNKVIEKLKNKKEFSQNFIWRCIQTVGKQGTSFAMFLIATAILTKGDMGIYNYVFSALYLLTIFADFGISTATSKFVAEYNATDKEKLKKVLFNSTLLIVVISILVSVIAYIFGERWFGEYYKYLVYLLPLVFFSPLTSLYDGIYRGLKRFKELAIISTITGLLSIGISYFLITSLRLEGALLAQVFMYILYAIVLAIGYRNWSISFDKKIIIDISKYAIAFGIATLGYYLFSKVNVLIMGKYNFFEEIASYELLNKSFTIYLLPFTILGQVLSPYVTELFAIKKRKEVKDLYFKSGKMLLLATVIFIPITYFGTILFVKIFFPQYDTEVLRLLLLPVTLTAAKNVFGAPINAGMIVATGHAGIMTIINIFAGIINVLLSLWVIKDYGFMGVIWVTFAVQLFFTFVLNYIYIKKLNKYE